MSDNRYSTPADKFTAVTPGDATLLKATRAIYVGGTGNIAVKPVGSSTAVVFSSVPAGLILPISVEYVMATGTTATNIVALY